MDNDVHVLDLVGRKLIKEREDENSLSLKEEITISEFVNIAKRDNINTMYINISPDVGKKYGEHVSIKCFYKLCDITLLINAYDLWVFTGETFCRDYDINRLKLWVDHDFKIERIEKG